MYKMFVLKTGFYGKKYNSEPHCTSHMCCGYSICKKMLNLISKERYPRS